jgi:acyl-CoA reductase-like NAD-dependent aldehyde dehydrogenase
MSLQSISELIPPRLFIGGQWRPSSSRMTFPVLDPGTGQKLMDVCGADACDVDLAVEAAKEAFKKSGWAEMNPNERGVYLHRLADRVAAHKQTLARIESLDVGKPLAQAVADVEDFCATLRYYTDLAQHISYQVPIAVSGYEARTVHHPCGVCGFIFPWNFPLLLIGWSVSPALAAGNTVVIKPAEDTPLSTLYLMQLVKEADIPDGVINVVPGLGHVAGAALARHPALKRMSFTGSPEIGRKVALVCGENLVPVKLELGGKGAAVIFEDVDVERTADRLVGYITCNAGQMCCAASRWLIHKDIYTRFVQRASERMEAVRIGYWDDPATDMGPLVSEKQRQRVLGYLKQGRDEGAEVLLEGGAASVQGKPGGFYVKPAMLAGDPGNVAAREEIFGPVPFLLKFRTEEEAIRLVNLSPYGLANSVWSADLCRAHRVAERLASGSVWINAHNLSVQGVTFAGINRSGLGGGVLGPNALLDYLRKQSVVRPLGDSLAAHEGG